MDTQSILIEKDRPFGKVKGERQKANVERGKEKGERGIAKDKRQKGGRNFVKLP